jgi:hypothetical protein
MGSYLICIEDRTGSNVEALQPVYAFEGIRGRRQAAFNSALFNILLVRLTGRNTDYLAEAVF